MDFETYNLPGVGPATGEETKRWLLLRAVEWCNFPAFISQLVAPILFMLYPWYFVTFGIFALSILWCAVRYPLASASLAGAAVNPVFWLKWPVAIGSCLYLFFHQQRVAAVVAFAWPLLAAVAGAPAGFSAKIARVELAFARQVGLVSDADL
jgi:hypothetical protein